MREFKDLVHKEHPNCGHFDTQAIEFFDNGYGVSVVRGGDGLYELAVLEGTEDSWGITHTTPITDDVVVYLTETGVTLFMEEVQKLEKVNV